MTRFEAISNELVTLQSNKNADYGDSFFKTYDEFGLTSTIIRLSDKLNRLKTINEKTALVKDESIRDTLLDLAGYTLMTVEAMDYVAQNEEDPIEDDLPF